MAFDGQPSTFHHSARERHEQRLRAEACTVQRLLAGYQSLVLHRGAQPSQLGFAFKVAWHSPPQHDSASIQASLSRRSLWSVRLGCFMQVFTQRSLVAPALDITVFFASLFDAVLFIYSSLQSFPQSSLPAHSNSVGGDRPSEPDTVAEAHAALYKVPQSSPPLS